MLREDAATSVTCFTPPILQSICKAAVENDRKRSALLQGESR
jgi:hypothetical protein